MTDMRLPKVVLCPPPDDEDLNYEEEENTSCSSLCQPTTDTATSRSSAASILPQPLQQNFDLLKKRKLAEDEASRIAEETAAMIRAEVRRMQNAVAELEAYLDNAGGEQQAVQAHDDDDDGESQEENESRDGSDDDDDGEGHAVVVREDELEGQRLRRRQQPNHLHRFPELPRFVVIEPAAASTFINSSTTEGAVEEDEETE
jgi:hypothetical protein